MTSLQEGTQVPVTHIRWSHPAKTFDGSHPLNVFAEQPILNTWKGLRINSLRINQWKDTSEVIEWFCKIPDKNRYKFLIFDIKDIYLSISEKLLTNTLNFAKE